MSRQRISILGATGSIGHSTLDVIGRNREQFTVAALSSHSKPRELAQLCRAFDCPLAVMSNPALTDALAAELKAAGSRAEILSGPAGLEAAAASGETDSVMAAIVGAAGLGSSIAAARAGKKILLANKESLVIAGQVFITEARESGAMVVPVDSEHNAIFQALPDAFSGGLEASGVEKIILTASGGPFLDCTAEQLQAVTPEQACNHPNWDMGRKISVDSATLMNKGLEVIEARWLFDAAPDQLEVLIHPQSIVHSMVAYRDGSVLAQMGTPDMRTPIAHALAWPNRIESGVDRLNLATAGDLSFREPDLLRFPCLGLAFEAMRQGDGAPAVLNAANEIAVQAFLDGKMGFRQIPQLVDAVMNSVAVSPVHTVEDVMQQDRVARSEARRVIDNGW
jgi:1-deoxy-D-xylulose-5-phosphate reductoisomerase